MEKKDRLVVFTIDGRQFGIALPAVERIVHAVEVTSLPGTPSSLLGIINVQGSIVPVVNTRARLGLAARSIAASDRFIIAETSHATLSLVVDDVVGLLDSNTVELTDQSVPITESGCIRSMTKTDEGMVLVCDLDRMVDRADLESLDESLDTACA